MYLRTEGNIDTRHTDNVQVFTNADKSDSDISADDFLEFGGNVYAYDTDGVDIYISSDAAWTSDVLTDSVRDMWHNGLYLFACRENDTIVYAGTDGLADSDWTEAGVDTDQKGAFWIQHHDGYVYAGKESDCEGHKVFFDDSIILSSMHLVSSDDPQSFPVGIAGMQVLKPMSYRGDFLFRRPDGVYRMDNDRAGSRVVLDYKDQESTANFRSWAVHNGQMVYPVRDDLWQWNGVRTVPMSPPQITHTVPLITYGEFDNFVVIGRFLFLTAKTSHSTYQIHILCYDGIGWHKVAEPVTDGAGTINAMYYEPHNNFLWYDLSGEVYNIPFKDLSELPFDKYPASIAEPHITSSDRTYNPNGLITSKISAGYKRVTKSTPSVILEGQNCSTVHYLSLYYALDNSTSWQIWGAEDGISNVLTTDGVKVFADPLGTGETTLEYKNISFYVGLNTVGPTGNPWGDTGLSSASPILQGLYPRLLMRPDTLYGWSFNIKASQHAQYGVGITDETAKEILDELKDYRDSYAPILFVDAYGEEYQVYVSSISEAAVEYHVGRPGPSEDIEQTVTINLVQVG